MTSSQLSPPSRWKRWIAGATAALAFGAGAFAFQEELAGFLDRLTSEPTAQISSPVDAHVPHVVHLHGTLADVPATDQVWAMTQDRSTKRLHPQPEKCTRNPATSTYLCGSLYIGAEVGGAGGQFVIYVVAADPEAAMEFMRYHASQLESGGYPGMEDMPDGATVLASKEVIRR